MENEQHEKYEYARNRIRQKKRLYYHFVVFLLGSLFMYLANNLFQVLPDTQWYSWVIALWLFLFILHFIRVYITDRFMNKQWERDQINKLIAKQEQRIAQLEKKHLPPTEN